MVNRPKQIGTRRVPQRSLTPCACGCGQYPAAYNSEYMRGHRPLRVLSDRLWSRVVEMPSGRWEWQGSRREPPWNYGEIGRGRRGEGVISTHRAAWEITHGPIPGGLMVLHGCDNPPCCNPAHLRLGTAQNNSDDAVERARVARGPALPHTRLSETQVALIRQMSAGSVPQRRIAEAHGISQSYVSEIVNRVYRRAA